VPSTLETLWRSSGSNVSSVPDPASTTSPPASIRAEPETTISQARSRTWCSPSSSPGARRMMIARAPSTVSRASARRVPSGTSISFTFHVCTGSDSRRSRILLLALLPEARPKARKLPTRYGARDVGAQANRIRHAGPASRFNLRATSRALQPWRSRQAGPSASDAVSWLRSRPALGFPLLERRRVGRIRVTLEIDDLG